MSAAEAATAITAKDFATDQEVRWCPGCGDYAILKAVQKTMAEIGASNDNTVFISGIGCAARFPYYIKTYGFHTIHGRAPAFATGIKLANPELDVWVVSGDGDALSIGGNHFLHLLRRNVNLRFLLFNNAIYGLTKGQYSPTSLKGVKTPSSPMGTVESPLSACKLALGAGARFVGRGVDTAQKRLPGVLGRAHEFQGTAFVEIFQNCIVFNDSAFGHFTNRDVADDMQVWVEHGKSLVFGKDGGRGLRRKPGKLELEAVTIGEDGVTEGDLTIHDETDQTLAMALASMEPPWLPVALGVLYCVPGETYEREVWSQVEERRKETPNRSLNRLYRSGPTWTVE